MPASMHRNAAREIDKMLATQSCKVGPVRFSRDFVGFEAEHLRKEVGFVESLDMLLVGREMSLIQFFFHDHRAIPFRYAGWVSICARTNSSDSL